MGNLFTRIKTTLAADLHGLLDEKERKNPMAMLNEYLRQCEKEIESVNKLIKRQYLLKEEFTKELQYAEDMAKKRKAQAEIALKAEEEELYNVAISDQNHFEERAGRLRKSLEITTNQLQELEKKYKEMMIKLKDMKLKKYELMGRENIARANMKADQFLNETDANAPYSRFQEIESYIDRIEQQVNSNYLRNMLDTRISQIEKEMKQDIQVAGN